MLTVSKDRIQLARWVPQTENQRTMTDLPTDPISPQARQGTVDRLCAHFAVDHLKTAEFERRLDLAYAVQTGAELMAIEQDLPELRPVPAPLLAARVDTTRPTRDWGFLLAIMGRAKRKENWTLPRRLPVLTMLGGAVLDFRDATFATPEIHVWLCSFLGGVQIIVPPGVHVESNGIAILGRFGGGAGRPTDPNAPTIRVHGLVMLGAVSIKERLPGESKREARRRLKAERMAKRLGGVSPGIEH